LTIPVRPVADDLGGHLVGEEVALRLPSRAPPVSLTTMPRALAREQEGPRASNSSARSGDDGDLAFEKSHADLVVQRLWLHGKPVSFLFVLITSHCFFQSRDGSDRAGRPFHRLPSVVG